MFIMVKFTKNNRRWISALLTMATMFMSTASGASWQCPDGHLCPPGCKMMQPESQGKAVKVRACCLESSQSGVKAAPSQTVRSCTVSLGCKSSRCVLRYLSKPDVRTSPTSLSIPMDVQAILPVFALPIIISDSKTCLYALPPRAPPRNGFIFLHSPRAPPVL